MQAEHLLLTQIGTALPFLVIEVRVIYVLARHVYERTASENPFFYLLLINNVCYLFMWVLINVFQYNYPIYYAVSI